MKRNVRMLCTVFMILTGLFSMSCKEKQIDKGEPSPENLVSNFRNVIYTYTLGDVKYPEMYSHIIISFFRTDQKGNLMENSFPHTKDTIIKFKKEHPSVKVMAALGGGVYSEFLTPVVLDSTSRKNLAHQLSNFLIEYKLDGLDLDWEYYDDYAESNEAYLDLAKQIRKNTPRGTVLSMAGQKAPEFYRDQNIIEMMTKVLDFTSVMTYDFDYENRMNKTVGYNGSFAETKNLMEEYYAAICFKSKLNTGLPFYGSKWKIKDTDLHYFGDACHSFGGGVNYSALTAALGAEGVKNPMAYDEDMGVAISVKGHDLFVFDNETTLKNKVQWSCREEFGGVMEWVASDDDALCTLQKVVTDTVNNSSK